MNLVDAIVLFIFATGVLVFVVTIFGASQIINFLEEYFVSGSDCQRCLNILVRDRQLLTVTTLITQLGYSPRKAKRVLKYLLHHQLITQEFNLETGANYYALPAGEEKCQKHN